MKIKVQSMIEVLNSCDGKIEETGKFKVTLMIIEAFVTKGFSRDFAIELVESTNIKSIAEVGFDLAGQLIRLFIDVRVLECMYKMQNPHLEARGSELTAMDIDYESNRKTIIEIASGFFI